jgi:hypothetical protein
MRPIVAKSLGNNVYERYPTVELFATANFKTYN